jgi:hypothetical protein
MYNSMPVVVSYPARGPHRPGIEGHESGHETMPVADGDGSARLDGDSIDSIAERNSINTAPVTVRKFFEEDHPNVRALTPLSEERINETDSLSAPLSPEATDTDILSFDNNATSERELSSLHITEAKVAMQLNK